MQKNSLFAKVYMRRLLTLYTLTLLSSTKDQSVREWLQTITKR
jgi:hypothetical protein